MFRAIVRKAPLDVLDIVPKQRNLVSEARHTVEYNAKMRIELARDNEHEAALAAEAN